MTRSQVGAGDSSGRGEMNGISRTHRALEHPQLFMYALVAPAVFVILMLGIYPLVKLAVTSFQGITMFRADESFHGVENFARLFQDGRLWASLGRTLVFTLVALPIETILGYLLALLFLSSMPFRRTFVAIILLPTVISPIVAGATWKVLLDHRFGPVNQIIGWIVGRDVKLLWTVESNLVWPAILAADVWQWTPFMFLITLAALSNLNSEQLEAAEVDGAGAFTVFSKIVLPAILPVVAVAILIRGLDLFRIFDIIWMMTQGGPGTQTESISIYLYQVAFREFEVSYAAAIAFLVIVVLTVVVVAALRRVEITR